MVTGRARAWLAEQAEGGRRGTTLLLLLGLLALAGWIVWDRAQSDAAAEASEENTRAIAEQVLRDACQPGDPTAQKLADVCRQAEAVAEQPAEQVLVPPTDEQLRPIVQEYVAQWLQANPPRPGRDGVTPSVETISALIVAELAANPPPAGEQGEPGRPPTVAELQPIVVAAVAEHLEANPPPPGQPGEDGEDGADSTVPGPPGEPPLSWTFTTTDPIGRETTHRCVRAEPFDPDAPRYECEPVEEEQGVE